MIEKKGTSTRIPEFASREEEAEWFDIHDLGDYLDEFTVLDNDEVQVAENLSNLTESFTVRLSLKDLQEIRAHANEKGLGASTLVRMWIYEHLRAGRKGANPGA